MLLIWLVYPMTKLYQAFLAAGALVIVSGCGGKEEVAMIPAADSGGGGGAVAVQPTSETPPPPTAPPPVAPPAVGGPAAPAAAASTGSSTTAAIGTIAGDPLAFYRYDSQGKPLDDLRALQNAIDSYSRSAGMTFTPTDKPKPPLSKLEDLVSNGFLRGVPAPPAGKRYVFDAATQKVTVAD